MNGPGLIFVVIPIGLLICLVLTVLTDRPCRGQGAREYLYVPCVRVLSDGHPAATRRWVQAVPIVKKTAKWIYYTSETRDRSEAVVDPGCISRRRFEADGMVSIPGDRRVPSPAGGVFYATPEAARADLYRSAHERTEPAGRETPRIKELRRSMADAHPDRGGTAQEFIEARHRYEAALRPGRR